jgi:hypothetical protein
MADRIPRDAYAIVIGSMKCGTSSLYDYLQGHPQICPAIDKEPEFFSENQGHGVQVDNYSDLWPFNDSVHKYALEASSGYTKYPSEPNVPKNIYDYGIRPKFIYIIRNPFDRITSHFNFMQWDKTWRLNIVDSHLISTSNYFLQLEQYRKYFPQEDILILDFDELRDNPRLVLQRIYQFLDLSHSYFPEDYEVKNPTQMGTKLERNLRSLKLGSLNIGALFGHVPNPLKKLGQKLLRGAFPPEKRILTDAEKEFVYNELKQDMAKLHHIYGIDVSKWGFDIQRR